MLDGDVFAAVVALDTAEDAVILFVTDALIEVESEALRVLGTPDAVKPDEAVVEEPAGAALLVCQYAASRDCTSPTFRYASSPLKNATLAWITASEKLPLREVKSLSAKDLG
jgi:hypothetical protein